MLFFRQYDLACLSLFSYMVGDTASGRAVVVDPQRDISAYLEDAQEHGLTIERVIETHFHADFLSGHLELAAATGAVISYGSVAEPDFPIEPLEHGQRLPLGEVTIEVRHTPGHTPESISLVVHETPDGPPAAVLTGDALFIGDVGRPDLFTARGHSPDEMARDLYRSLHEQLLTLPDETVVYPAHGAGSACGKNLSAAVSSTIGEQRASNYALQPMAVERFVDVVTEGQSVAPRYFAFAADANRRRHELLDDHEPPPALTIADAVHAQSGGAVLVDTRAPESFASGHVRGSINVGLEGRFAEYAGNVLTPDQPIVLVGDAGHATEARVRLGRIGFDRVLGAVDDVEAALAERPELAQTAQRLPAHEVAAWLADPEPPQVLDVRNPGEISDTGTLPGAVTIPMAQLLARVAELDPERGTVVCCAGGYRSSIAASYLRSQGFSTVADILGGYAAWAAVAAG